jgi:hypothetical protein
MEERLEIFLKRQGSLMALMTVVVGFPVVVVVVDG